VFGFHAVLSRVRADPSSVLEIFLDETRNDARARDLATAAERAGVKLMRVPTKRLDGFYGGGRHQGVVARIEIKSTADTVAELLDQVEKPLLLVLDGVTDPHNLGACLRTADAMGVHGVIVPKDRSVGLTPTVAKVASGAAESVPLIVVTNLARAMEQLKEAGVWLLGAAEEGEQSLFEARLKGAVAWVMGAEGQGLRRLTRERCDALVRIPMFGHVESLNVSVAAALCLFETRRQRELGSRG
jgi:23S rRNA (guanosine2251-2'-O)-methyltransferase